MDRTSLLGILAEALDDERKAEATYAAVIDRFGPVCPFSNIIEAERRHAAALIRQFDRLGAPPPPNPWPDRIAPPESLADACRQAIAGEIENIAIFDRLLPSVTDPAARKVLERLQNASRERHLPAFRRHLARLEAGEALPADAPACGEGGGQGCGEGRGRGRRHRHGRRRQD